jgi:L-seryl-tRNA(Ser) seleniumtransferase
MGVYEQLGLQPIINASGAVTRLGGSPWPPAVLEVFCQAARACVPLEQLQAAASRVIAQATGAEAGLVTAGAAAALTLGTAAILAGNDLGRMERLPHCDGFGNELLVARDQRNPYDHAVRAAGARLVEVGYHEPLAGSGVRCVELWEYEAACTPQTAGVLYVYRPDARPPLEAVVEWAHRRGLPVLVDAAGELPPRANLRLAAATGADLVAFSGGKAIRGPQATGILCGRGRLVASAAMQMLDTDDFSELWEPPAELFGNERWPGLPRQGIGRGYKVSKEQIVALLAALRLFISGAYEAEQQEKCALLEGLAQILADCPVECRLHMPPEGEGLPLLEIALRGACARDALAICRRLRSGSPPIYLGHGLLPQGKLLVNPLHLDRAAMPVLAQRLREELLASGA